MKATLDFLTQLLLQLPGSKLVDTEAPALPSTQMPSVGTGVPTAQLNSEVAGLDFAPPYDAMYN